MKTDPAIIQRNAINSSSSVWVSASAGTGKTKVLTDRVLALLLDGTAAHRILCLTFTRAAAAEMANRINQALAIWAECTNQVLSEKIFSLTGEKPEKKTLSRARRLFSEVLDIPGGMKIQTLHAFCESLLSRFPLEAGLSPHFSVMDEMEASDVLKEARTKLVTRARFEKDGLLTSALAEVTGYLNEIEFNEILVEVCTTRSQLRYLFKDFKGMEHLVSAVYALLGVEQNEETSSIWLAGAATEAFDADGLKEAARLMLDGSKTDQKNGKYISDWIRCSQKNRVQTIDDYLQVFFTKSGEKRARLVHKNVIEKKPKISEILSCEANRLQTILEKIRTLVTAKSTSSLLILAQTLLEIYEMCKRERGRLDYDDLILGARDLLEKEGRASWVMYKLDGGIDHILIDEAQDTSPDQWGVITALAEEFFSGEGAVVENRTLFAVGDPKQSIYSFQRADPEAFEVMRAHFKGRARKAKKTWLDVNLDISFRSTPAVLEAVDKVFENQIARDGVVDSDMVLQHKAFRSGQSGLVELWPPVEPLKEEKLNPWEPPVSIHWKRKPEDRLAKVIADLIREWLEKKEILKSKNRPIFPGDILVLVRRRGVFVEGLIKALKQNNIPVSGVDRMVLKEQLSVRDLIALGEFSLLPQDELVLATILKGPFFGFSEEDLFDLAYKRNGENLWSTLRRKKSENPKFAIAVDELNSLLSRADFNTPFELYAEILGRNGGRKKILGRLGPEANDPIDEFLSLALEYEKANVPSLQGFLHWVNQGNIEIKRDLEQTTHNHVRVMTVHGSKGLEAPIVFLPDSLQDPPHTLRLLWSPEGIPLWPPRRRFAEKICEQAITNASTKQQKEYKRLLYVAMTRAEDRLYVCGWKTRRNAKTVNWYELLEAAMSKIGKATEFDFSAISSEGWSGMGWRLKNAQELKPEATISKSSFKGFPQKLPDWAKRSPEPEKNLMRTMAPSQLEQSKLPIQMSLGKNRELNFQRGKIIHQLLQMLPGIPKSDRLGILKKFLAQPSLSLNLEHQKNYSKEILTVLEESDFSYFFGPNSRSEVPVTGYIGKNIVFGQVDRLVIGPKKISIIDFKTNIFVPPSINEVPKQYLAQMAAYKIVLKKIFPVYNVECVLLWTHKPSFMLLPEETLKNFFIGLRS
ncbi:MAG: double-strand break repair helicase AddA [Pseudomonadota bacterium]|nr:double-strand break repair helicase AddA [Pseudomonadota bacterium]